MSNLAKYEHAKLRNVAHQKEQQAKLAAYQIQMEGYGIDVTDHVATQQKMLDAGYAIYDETGAQYCEG